MVLIATVEPSDATDKRVSWRSHNTSVATVQNGKVIGVSTGSTYIVVTTQNGDKTADCEVKVGILPNFCNTRTPGWGVNLGTVGFATNQTMRIGSQTWSDAVTSTACNKTTFSGGDGSSQVGFNADCLSNPDYPGDLFSWCAVVRFENILCPTPWRVPTKDDFINLDKALGGTGSHSYGVGGGSSNDPNIYGNRPLYERYLNTWRFSLGGCVDYHGVMRFQKTQAFYWSQTDCVYHRAYGWNIIITPSIVGGSTFSISISPPRDDLFKGYGQTLRCVRDN
jgi:uncharacterized protein (TIGR02145 family)